MPKETVDPNAKVIHCYIGRIACGCMVAVCFDEPDFPKATATSVADFIKSGYAVERVTYEQYHVMSWGCIHKTPKQPEPLLPGMAPAR